MIEVVAEQTVNQDIKGRFVKGNKANPTGSNGYTTVRKLEEALNDKAKQKNYKDFPSYVAERALINDQVLIAVLKKLIADKIKGEGFDSVLKNYVIIRSPESTRQNQGIESEAGRIHIQP